MPKSCDLSVKFTGDVFSLFVEVEGKEVDLLFDGVDTWRREIKNFPIEGGLDFRCVAKGLAGTDCKLDISADGKALPTQGGTITRHALELKGSIDLEKKELVA